MVQIQGPQDLPDADVPLLAEGRPRRKAGRSDGQRLLSVGRWMFDIEAPRGTGQELVADARLEEASCCVAIGEESPTVEEGHW